MKRIPRYATAIAVTTVVVAAAPTVAIGAELSPESAFGQHVSDCARTMGFDGEHNPGMHHGITDWDGSSCPSDP